MQSFFLRLLRNRRLVLILMGGAVCLQALPLDSLWEIAWLGVLGTGYVLLGLAATAPRQVRIDFGILGQQSSRKNEPRSSSRLAPHRGRPLSLVAEPSAANPFTPGDEVARVAEILTRLRAPARQEGDRDGLVFRARRQIFIVGVEPDRDDAERLFVDREEPEIMLWPGQFHVYDSESMRHQCPPGTIYIFAAQGDYCYQAADGRVHRLDEVWFTTCQMLVTCQLGQECGRMAGRNGVSTFSPVENQPWGVDLHAISQLLREGMLVFRECD